MPGVTSDSPAALNKPELVIGLVTPVGTRTSALADSVRTRLSEYGYESEVIHLSDYIPSPVAPAGELYDARVRRLMAAGNALCALNDLGDKEGGRASIARLAVLRIMLMRAQLHRQDGREGDLSTLGLMPRPNTAYILHSLKRVEEVQLLRQIYGGQFILLGSQDSHDNRLQELLSRPLSGGTAEGRVAAAEELMRTDADDTQGRGQRINKTYPLADYFLSSTDPERFFKILFGFPIAPLVDEYAVYAAEGAFGRSLAASRKVGAALVQNESLIATGYNDVPHGQTADVLAGQDTSEVFKRNNVRDTLERLAKAGLLNPAVVPSEVVPEALTALEGGQLMNVIEYQRAVHAEARCLDDALVRGISSVGTRLFVTTFPCHLCYKHILSARVAEVRYIEPYPKSRAQLMYPSLSGSILRPYEGTAPGRYYQLFVRRAAFMSDADGTFRSPDPLMTIPLIERPPDARRAQAERDAISQLKLK